MPAYLIVTAYVHDREKFMNGYAAAAETLIGQFGGEYLLRGPGAECLEGELADGASMVISKWPDRETVKRFWNSPEYTEAKKLREGIADVQVMVIDGPDINA